MLKSHVLKAFMLLTIFGIFLSCSRDQEKNTPTPKAVVLTPKTYSNLYAPQSGGQGQPADGEFVKFSFSKNSIVTDDNWDIAFRGTTILVNGGTKVGIQNEPSKTGKGAISIVSGTFDTVKAVPDASTFKQDGANKYAIPSGSGNGWYNYNSNTNVVTPIPGRVFVVKTYDEKYAKMEIISYYKDAPANPTIASTPRYYTFKFVYQPDGNNF